MPVPSSRFWFGGSILAVLIAMLAPFTASAVEPSRIVATGGRIGYTFYRPAPDKQAFRHRSVHQLGGPVTEIQIGFLDWMYSDKAEITNAENDVTLTHVWLERASTGQIVPLTFSGSRTLVLPKESTTPYWLCDPVPASAWTGPALARDDVFWLNVRGTIPQGGVIPAGTPVGYPGTRFIVYPPANEPASFDTPGPIPAIAAGATRTDGVPIIFLGRYTGPGHLSVIGIGDSILHGSGDHTGGAIISGYGFFNRAALDANGKNTIATFNLTRHGQSAAAWITPNKQSRQRQLLPFANVVVESYGTNDLASAGAGDPTVILDRLDAIWTAARQAGVQRIVRTLLLPRTSSTDNWMTPANQTSNSGWSTGSKRDHINSGLYAALSAGKVDYIMNTLAVVADPTDPGRWLTNGTAKFLTIDGTHVSPAGNALLAVSLRATLLSLTVDQ